MTYEWIRMKRQTKLDETVVTSFIFSVLVSKMQTTITAEVTEFPRVESVNAYLPNANFADLTDFSL